jgi:hypothetical protein
MVRAHRRSGLSKTLLTAALLSSLAGLAVAAGHGDRSPFDPNVEDLTSREEPPMLGIHWSKEMHAAIHQAARRSANMTYHGGKIMPTATTKAIFKGTSWATYNGDKITGMDLWYSGFSSSHYAATVTEYTGSNGCLRHDPPGALR